MAAPEEVTVKEDSKSLCSGKKRKKEKVRLSDITEPNTSSDTLESKEVIDKCKSPHNKKLRLAPDKNDEKVESVTVETVALAPTQEQSVNKESKQKRRTSKDQDVLNYLDKNCEKSKFNMDDLDFEPDETASTEEDNERENEKESVTEFSKTLESNNTSEEEKPSTSVTKSDSLVFTAVPVAVRQPLKLPRHAANILSSRTVENDALDEDDGQTQVDQSNLDSDLEYSFVSDGSDSELESLASECSTMSAVSENSSVGTGEESEGVGKKKRRGRKKKRKNRRKAHVGKCSKEQHRVSDLAMLSHSSTEKMDGKTSRSNPREKHEAAPQTECEPRKDDAKHMKNIGGNIAQETIKIKEAQAPMVQLQNTVFHEVMSSDESSPIKPVLPTTPMIVTPAADNQEYQPVVNMSVTPGKTPASAMSVESSISEKEIPKATPPVMSISPEDLSPSPGAPSPKISDSDSDLEMSDLSHFQLKWGEVTPLSPMSVTENEVDLEKDKGKKTPMKQGKKIHIPSKGKSIERKGLKVLLPFSGTSEDSNIKNKKEITFHEPQKIPGSEKQLEKTLISKTHENNKVTKEKTVSETKDKDECQLFKQPQNPKPSPSRPFSHPSPGYSSLTSPNYSSQKYLSLPCLLSPMPATPKSHHDEEDKTSEHVTSDINTDISFDAPEKISKELSEEKENLGTANDIKSTERNNKSEGQSDIASSSKLSPTDKPTSVKKGLPDGPYPRRRGRKSTAKKFVTDEEYESSYATDSQSSSPTIMKPPETPPKRGRGRPPKIKTPEIQTTPPTLSNTSPIAKPDSRPASPTKSQLTPKKCEVRCSKSNQVS